MTNSTSTATASASPSTTSTRLLLGAGVVAGPIFVVTAGVQAATRHGFSLSHQPLSMLSLGDLGWIQITNFVLAGLLSLAFSMGVARWLATGPGHASIGTGLPPSTHGIIENEWYDRKRNETHPDQPTK